MKRITCSFSGGWLWCGQSKLTNILYARDVARRYPSIKSVSIHPGVVSTSLIDNLSSANRAIVYATKVGRMIKPSEDVYNQLWVATVDKPNVKNGQVYEPVGQLITRL